MAITAKLFALGMVREPFNVNLIYHRHVRRYGKPSTELMGGMVTASFISQADDEALAERMIADRLHDRSVEYPKNVYLPMDMTIKFYEEGREIYQWVLRDGLFVNYFTEFHDQYGMVTTVKFSASIQIIKGVPFVKRWNESWVPPGEGKAYKELDEANEKEPFAIFPKADRADIKNGTFGFDRIPPKNIVESDYVLLEKEYNPLPEKILGDTYCPAWVSLRKEQTVELRLDWDQKKNADGYTGIAFVEHPNFSIEPKELKGAKQVKITCNANSQEPVQLPIKADGATVGALNLFCPTPKTIELEWCFVEIEGSNFDYKSLGREINRPKLESALKKGLNPALVDVTLVNDIPTLVDISTYREGLKKRGYLKKHPEKEIGKYMERSKINGVLNYVHLQHKVDSNRLTVYFINQKCIRTEDINEDGTFKQVGGLSPTGTGIAYLPLDEDGNILTNNIIHETMHALGLKHTFGMESQHSFKQSKTDNYMDYDNTKRHTYAWQWKKLHQYPKLK